MSTTCDTAGSQTEQINAAVVAHILPMAPTILASENPLPVTMLKLLCCLVPANPDWMLILVELGISKRLFYLLSGAEEQLCNAHLIQLCRYAADTGALTADELRTWKASFTVCIFILSLHVLFVVVAMYVPPL